MDSSSLSSELSDSSYTLWSFLDPSSLSLDLFPTLETEKEKSPLSLQRKKKKTKSREIPMFQLYTKKIVHFLREIQTRDREAWVFSSREIVHLGISSSRANEILNVFVGLGILERIKIGHYRIIKDFIVF